MDTKKKLLNSIVIVSSITVGVVGLKNTYNALVKNESLAIYYISLATVIVSVAAFAYAYKDIKKSE